MFSKREQVMKQLEEKDGHSVCVRKKWQPAKQAAWFTLEREHRLWPCLFVFGVYGKNLVTGGIIEDIEGSTSNKVGTNACLLLEIFQERKIENPTKLVISFSFEIF